MKVIPYDPTYEKDFIEMNKAWIRDMFTLEPADEEEFLHIGDYIGRGGQIFFALDESGDVMATCMVAPREDGDWEIMKFAAKGEYAGRGAGSACLKACIDYAKEKNVAHLIIVTNHKCTHAIHLYQKAGFLPMPLDKEKFPFERGDTAFEMYPNQTK